jgi:hypothetical protein
MRNQEIYSTPAEGKGGRLRAGSAVVALTPDRRTQEIDELEGRVDLQSPGQLCSPFRHDAILCRHTNKGGDETRDLEGTSVSGVGGSQESLRYQGGTG